ncbi:MAG: hypothetical protein ACK5WA_05710 [Alphaproteobacteria bacterium]
MGATIGKIIGSQFIVEITNIRYEASLDIPEVTTVDQEIIFDVPEIEMRDNDIIFNFPTLVMKTVEGPSQPVPVCGSRRECVTIEIGPYKDEKCVDVPYCNIEMRPTYLDQPTWEDREQRITLGVPVVVMKPQRFVLGVPEIRMQRQDISFDVPSVTIRYQADASKATSAAVENLQKSAEGQLLQKRLSFKERMRLEVAPLAIEMFDCHKQQIRNGMTQVASMFDPQIQQLRGALATMLANGVPDTDDDYINAKARVDGLITKRAEALENLQKALTQLENSSNQSLEQMLNG